MKYKILIALATVFSLSFILLSNRNQSEPIATPEITPEVTASTTDSKLYEPIEPLSKEILTPIKRVEKVVGRDLIAKAAFLSVQSKGGSTTDPVEWINALEWCESNGDNTAINKIDRDGTASYYAFQFKPSTFRGYATQYGIIEKGVDDMELMELLADYELTRSTVWRMMQDPAVRFENQFPDCVRKHIGHPPQMMEDTTLI